MRSDLRDDPAVFKVASITQLDRFNVVGRLATFWGWTDKHAVDGRVDGASIQVVDDVVGFPGFAQALVLVGWLLVDAQNVYIPNHERHNIVSGKERSLKNARQAKWRAKKALGSASNVDEFVDGDVDASLSTKTSTREEKRREEKNTNTSPAKLPTCPTQKIVDAYHEILPSLPAVRIMSAKRAKPIAALWKWVLTTSKPDGLPRATNAESAMAWVRAYFSMATENDFLMGRSQRSAEHAGWQCDLDFLMTEKGMRQVIEKTRTNA